MNQIQCLDNKILAVESPRTCENDTIFFLFTRRKFIAAQTARRRWCQEWVSGMMTWTARWLELRRSGSCTRQRAGVAVRSTDVQQQRCIGIRDIVKEAIDIIAMEVGSLDGSEGWFDLRFSIVVGLRNPCTNFGTLGSPQ